MPALNKFMKKPSIGEIVRNKGENVIYTENGWVVMYHYIFEKHHGRKPKKGYDIHHINFDHFDDRIENLIEVTRSQHRRMHKGQKKKSHLAEYEPIEKVLFKVGEKAKLKHYSVFLKENNLNDSEYKKINRKGNIYQ